jgi:transposase
MDDYNYDGWKPPRLTRSHIRSVAIPRPERTVYEEDILRQKKRRKKAKRCPDCGILLVRDVNGCLGCGTLEVKLE